MEERATSQSTSLCCLIIISRLVFLLLFFSVRTPTPTSYQPVRLPAPPCPSISILADVIPNRICLIATLPHRVTSTVSALYSVSSFPASLLPKLSTVARQ
jgi:hypothetical protein